MSVYFDSKDPRCKSPFGAVLCGTEVSFAVFFGPEDGILGGELQVREEFAGVTRTISLRRERSALRGTYTAPGTPELAWYSFTLRRQDGLAVTLPERQLTVYEDTATPDWFGRGVSYQIFPDRFCRSRIPDPAGMVGDRSVHESWADTPDFLPDDRGEVRCRDFFGGDLPGIIGKLDYLQELGVTTLYLTPIFESASNHRYNTADYRAIDPMLGSEEDFCALCSHAHRRGMRVVLDGVFNHTGSVSRYFNADGFYPELGAAQSKDSPYYPWYRFTHWPDGYDAWWGVHTLPAVNEECPSYREFIVDGEDSVVRHWLRLGASGWRLDVADELPDSVRQRPVYPIEEVVVTGTRNETDVRLLPMTVSVVDRAAIERSGRQSLLPILTEQVPGLFATARGIMGYGVSTGAADGMSLRGIGGAPQAGLPTTGLLVLIDGHPQYMGLMGHPIADAYQSMLAERVEVVRGPASVLYGSNAMGGVINIVTRKQREEGIRTDLQAAYGSYNTLQTELSNRIRKGRFTSVVTGSYNRTDGHRADMGFEQYGGYAKLGYELSRAWTLSGDVNLTHFNASNPGEVTAPLIDNDSRITRGRASAALANRYDRTSGALSLFYNWGRHKIDDGYAAGSEPLNYRFNSRDRMLGVSWYQSAQLFAGNRLTVGFDYFHFGGESWNRFLDGHEEPQVDKTQDEVAGYVDFRQSLGTWLTLDAGLRVDRHSHVGTEWVPQAGVSFHLPRSAEIKLSAGKGFRYPTIRELYMFRPANPDLRPERLWSYELSLSQRLWEGRLSYGVNLFYIDGENLILRMPVDGRQMNVNTGRIENAGVEAEIAYRISAAWSVDANYSFLHMEHPVLAAPEHKLHVGASFTQGRWSVSTGLQYVEGLYTSIVVGGTGSDAQENFILWNLRAGFRISRKLRIFVDGENLLAQRYEINAGFPMPRATVLGGLDMHF